MERQSKSGLFTSYPYLSQPEFNALCQKFAERYSGRISGTAWKTIGLENDSQGGRYLVIETKQVVLRNGERGSGEQGTSESEDNNCGEIEEEEDDEALNRSSPADENCLDMRFSICLSPTYQVPVLWFQFLGSLPNGRNGIDAIYWDLVPKDQQDSVRAYGNLGGISVANHPMTDFPCYFIHPCNTAEALMALDSGTLSSEDDYLLLWLGLVGPCVGLHVPNPSSSNKSPETLKSQGSPQ